MVLLRLLQRPVGRTLFLPAHGRGKALPDSLRRLLRRRAGVWDLPELPSIGGPLEPEGAVAISQKQAADAMGVDHCWYGVNGATGLLQAALLGLCRPGQAVLMPRNVHRSVIQACLLGQLTPLLFDLPFLSDRGHPQPADGAWLDRVLQALPDQHPGIGAAVLVHPTYQGYATDPAPLINRLQQRGWPVLVDEAHGSHFATGVDPDLPPSAVQSGADLVVHSLQKSASGLAQTAVLWLQGNRVDPDAIERSIGWLQTTSPSALLLASCEASLNDWQTAPGRQRLQRRLGEARRLKRGLLNDGLPLLETQDPLRLMLHTGAEGISGLEADDWLMKRRLVAELPEPATLTFCLGLAKHQRLRVSLRKMWRALLTAHPGRQAQPPFEPPPLPLVSLPAQPLAWAWRAPRQLCELKHAENSVAAELLCPYPPGIPLLVPGERLDSTRLNWLLRQQKLWGDQIPDILEVVDQTAEPEIA
ncbi:MAG: lysine decarboxylase [Synechococcus sp.]